MTTPSPSPRLAGHLLVECLIAQGVKDVFGVPGESYLAVLDGFHVHADAIRFVVNRQEGGAAYMAEAVGKLTGKPGVCFVTRGPGATNASIGVHTAFQDSTPMVLFVGDVASDTRDREAFQEVDFSAFFGPSTKGMAKRVERIDDAARIPEAVARAFMTAQSGRPGPVVVVLPEDMLTQAVPDALKALPALNPPQAWSDPGSLRSLRQMLLQARQPLVVAGGSGWTPQATSALHRFAENWQLPVANAFRFQDLFDNRHPQYAGDMGLGTDPGLRRRVSEADLLLVIGARMGEATTAGYTLLDVPVPKQTLVHIHVDAAELGRVYQPALSIQASMANAAKSLEGLTAPPDVPWAEWTASAHADYLASLNGAAAAKVCEGTLDMAAIIRTLSETLPPDAVISNGAGNFATWLHRFFQYRSLSQGLKIQLAPTNGAMGYGVPAGIAAALTTGRPVVTLTGDGDFLMNGQELATAVQHGVKTHVVVLLNNSSYGTIRMHQERAYPTHVLASDLRNPDFCALAKAYGYEAEKIEETSGFAPALARAMARRGGTLIELTFDVQALTTRQTLSGIRDAKGH
ncbi:thiamine pyrophosphate-binding protein [Hydrogenophaga sp. 5NK40-0174]|uniref:thiamine pyrophosphate-binding protein n=1 Tax=Hydrogenophaga sp. 5NK40-0174 TaxID=3127649 RepID=UPI0031092A81